MEFSRQEYWSRLPWGIFSTQGSNPVLLHCRQILYHLSHQGSSHQSRRWRFKSLGQKIPWKEMATHSSSFAWKIPWTEEPGGLQSTGPQRVTHDWVVTEHARTAFWKEKPRKFDDNQTPNLLGKRRILQKLHPVFHMTMALSWYTLSVRSQLQNHIVPSLTFVLRESTAKHHRDLLTFCYLDIQCKAAINTFFLYY